MVDGCKVLRRAYCSCPGVRMPTCISRRKVHKARDTAGYTESVRSEPVLR